MWLILAFTLVHPNSSTNQESKMMAQSQHSLQLLVQVFIPFLYICKFKSKGQWKQRKLSEETLMVKRLSC